MYAPLIPQSQKAEKEVQGRRQLSATETSRHGLPASSQSVEWGMEGAVLSKEEEPVVSLSPLLLSWICLPFLTIVIIMAKRFTSITVTVLFLPCCIGMGIFFALSHGDHRSSSAVWNLAPGVMLVFSSAQLICDVALTFFIFLDAEFRHYPEGEIQNREVYVGASVLLCMAHTLLSASVFADFYLSWQMTVTT